MLDLSYDFEITRQSRKNAEAILDSFDEKAINHIPKPFSNNLIWNYCHTIVTQGLLTYGLSGLWVPIDSDDIKAFRKDSFPDNQVNWDTYQKWKDISNELIDNIESDYNKGTFQDFKPYSTSYNVTLRTIEEAIRFNNAHEGLHLGACLAIRKFL